MRSGSRSIGLSAGQEEVNRRVYHDRRIAGNYAREERLTRAEAMTLLKHHAAFMGRDVLDIGIGAGRTTAYLAPLALTYLGIDYSPAMIEQVRAMLPQVPVLLGDMRNLDSVASASFDVVFASNCVVDAVSHPDRLRTLREFRRVLRERGLLIFSTHNRGYARARDAPRLAWSRNPGTLLANGLRWLRQLWNRRPMLALQRFEPDYALLTDVGHDYSCLHYYVHPETQSTQLQSQGFSIVEMLDRNGVRLAPGDTAPDSPWIMVVARATPPTDSPG